MDQRIQKLLLASGSVFALMFLVLPIMCQQGSGDTGNFQLAVPLQGTLALSNGEPLLYTYHFDHNALKDAVPTGDALIAITQSGDLVRFDATTLKITGQQIVPGRASAISLADDGRVLVGTREGQIIELNAATLAQKILFTAQGQIVWLGSAMRKRKSPMTVAVIDNDPEVLPWPGELPELFDKRSSDLEKSHRNPYSVAVHENGNTLSFALPQEVISPGPSSFLLEGTGRLWMGRDVGEFGGSFSSMDLRTGKVMIHSTDSGVSGFLKSADGRLFAYGGMAHIVISRGYVAEVKHGTLKFLAQFEADDSGKAPQNVLRNANQGHKPKAEDLPQGPIDLMVEDLRVGGFWVISSQVLHHASADFSRWSKTIKLGGRWYGGRQYSVGNTPTLNRLILDQSPSQGMIAVMGRDGLARVTGENLQRLPAADQLEPPVLDIWKTSIGTLLLSTDRGHSAWRLAGSRWQQVKFVPARESPEGLPWVEAWPFADDGSGILVFSGSNSSSGERGLFKADDRGIAELTRTWHDGSGESVESFVSTPEGDLLKITHNFFKDPPLTLQLRDGDLWREAGISKISRDYQRMGTPSGRRYIFLGKAGDDDFYLDGELGDLLQLTRKPDHMFLFDYAAHAAVAGIFDAVVDREGWFLAATVNGLWRFRLDDDHREAILSPSTAEEIRSVCRDQQGRLWAAGYHVYISADEGKHWEQVALPMLSPTDSKRIRQNPENPSEMMITLFDQGAVFVAW